MLLQKIKNYFKNKKNIRIVTLLLLPEIIFILFFNFYLLIYKNVPIRYWDEHGWVGRSYFFDFYIKKDFKNPIFQSYYGYNQPKLTEYIYGLTIYPLYRSKTQNKNITYAQFLANNNFIQIPKYYITIPLDFINWGKDPYKVFDVSASKLIRLFGTGIKKTIEIIYQARKINILFLSINVVIVYLMALFLFENMYIAIVSSLLYGFNDSIVNFGLKAQSDGLFVFLFNLTTLTIIYLLSKKKLTYIHSILIGILIGLLTSTKLNGIMLLMFIAMWYTIKFTVTYLKKNSILILKKYLISLLIITISFYSTFFVLDPFTWSSPIKNFLFMYQHRYKTALHQQNLIPTTKLPNFKSRLSAIFTNFFGKNGYVLQNLFFTSKNDFSKFNIFLILFFITGILFYLKYLNKKKILFISLFFFTLIITSSYLLLNWDRYFLHLSAFFILIETYGLYSLSYKLYLVFKNKMVV